LETSWERCEARPRFEFDGTTANRALHGGGFLHLSARSETRLEHVQGCRNGKEKRGEGLGLYRGGLLAFRGSKSRANRDLVAPYGVLLEDDATKKKEGKVGR